MQPSISEMELVSQKCDQRLLGGKICGARFDSPIKLVKHRRIAHGIPETYSPLIAAVVELKGPDFRSLDGEYAFMKMAHYRKDRFCILHVVEYKFWLRAWVTEADPSIDPKDFVPIKITVPAPDFENNKQEDELYQFTGKILPFGTYTFKGEGRMEYFDVPKTFLRHYFEKGDDGRFEIRILFAIGRYNAKEVFKDEKDSEKMVVLQINGGSGWDYGSGRKGGVSGIGGSGGVASSRGSGWDYGFGGSEGISGVGRSGGVSGIGGSGGISRIVGRGGISGVENKGASGIGEIERFSGIGEIEHFSGIGESGGISGIGGREGAPGVGRIKGISGVGETGDICEIGVSEGIFGIEASGDVSKKGGSLVETKTTLGAVASSGLKDDDDDEDDDGVIIRPFYEIYE